MEYMNVGTDVLRREYWNPVMDSENKLKPVCGLWCTEHKFDSYSAWIDYMLSAPSVFAHKTLNKDPFVQKAVVVSLKTGAKILTLRGEEGTHLYKDVYGYSFEKMGEDYDGVYVDLGNVIGSTSDERYKIAKVYSISSLILYNLDAIESYRSATIDIDPFDYECDFNLEEPEYTITYHDGVKRIAPVIPEYDELVNEIAEKFHGFVKYAKMQYPNISTSQIAYHLHKSVILAYEERIAFLSQAKGLDAKNLGYSVASNALSLIKKNN
jgi:hypothetical protein